MITSDNGCSVTFNYTLDQDIEALLADITTTDATSSEGGTAEIVTSNPEKYRLEIFFNATNSQKDHFLLAIFFALTT